MWGLFLPERYGFTDASGAGRRHPGRHAWTLSWPQGHGRRRASGDPARPGCADRLWRSHIRHDQSSRLFAFAFRVDGRVGLVDLAGATMAAIARLWGRPTLSDPVAGVGDPPLAGCHDRLWHAIAVAADPHTDRLVQPVHHRPLLYLAPFRHGDCRIG